MVSTLVIATVTLLFAVLLKLRRSSELQTLILPLVITSIAAVCHSVILLFTPDASFRLWSTAGLFLALGFLGSRAVLLLLFEWALQRRMGFSVPQLIRDLSAIAVYLTVGIIVLNTLGLKVTGLIATSAVLTAIIGFAFQETLGNLLAGLALAWEQRLVEGVWIDFDGQVVRIEDSGWRSTLLRTRLGERILVPNSDIASAQVPLLGSGKAAVAVPVHLGLSYSTPPDVAKKVLFEVAVDIPLVLRDPSPVILTTAFADSSISYECRLWTHHPWERNQITDIFLSRGYAALSRAGIEIPFPQLTVHRPRKDEHTSRPERRMAALQRTPLFSGLPAEALEAIATNCRQLRFAPGEAVVRQGGESRALFVVVSGEAAVDRDGREISRVGRGEIFGEGAFLTGHTRSATVRAGAEALEVLEISRKSLGSLFEKYPDLMEKLAHRLAERRLEGETLRDESGALVRPQGLVAHIKGVLARLVMPVGSSGPER